MVLHVKHHCTSTQIQGLSNGKACIGRGLLLAGVCADQSEAGGAVPASAGRESDALFCVFQMTLVTKPLHFTFLYTNLLLQQSGANWESTLSLFRLGQK